MNKFPSGKLLESIHCILKTLFLVFLQKFDIGRMKDKVVQKEANGCSTRQGKERIVGILGI